MEREKEFKVSAIKDGTVIDHIPSEQLFRVIEILGLAHCTTQMTFGMNLESKRMGNKAIIKITDKFFEEDDINRIALIAPHAKFNIIRDYRVVEKRSVTIPETIVGIARCVNPKCITNHQAVATHFNAQLTTGGLKLTCRYCEKVTDSQTLIIE